MISKFWSQETDGFASTGSEFLSDKGNQLCEGNIKFEISQATFTHQNLRRKTKEKGTLANENGTESI